MPQRKIKKSQLPAQPLPDSSATETNNPPAVVETALGVTNAMPGNWEHVWDSGPRWSAIFKELG